VDALIAAATERAHPQELAGEEAAIAAFRQAHRASARPAARTRRLVPVPGLVAGSLTAKIAISFGVLSFGGFALAAETGSLPTGAQSAAHRVFRAVGVPEADQQASARTGDATSDRTGQPTQTNGGGPQFDATSPVPGLCRAYTAGNRDEHGKALDSTAFQALAAAAGGEANIEVFCAGVLASSGPSPSPSATPSPTESPSPSATPNEDEQDETSTEATTASPSENANGPAHPPGQPHPTGTPTDLPAPANKGTP